MHSKLFLLTIFDKGVKIDIDGWCLYMISFSNNKEQQLINSNLNHSRTLIDVIKNTSIDNINFIIIGNSLSSGYSMSDNIAPFFDQYNILKKLLSKNNINYSINNFSIIAGNSNANILDIILNNRSIKYIKEINAHELQFDKSIDKKNYTKFSDVAHYKTTGFQPLGTVTKTSYQNNYQINDSDEDICILNILKQRADNTQNIVIFNGFTGEFMDSIFRDGKLKFIPSLLHDEYVNLSIILKTIVVNDPKVMTIVGSVPHFTIGKVPVIAPLVNPNNRHIARTVNMKTNSYTTDQINIKLLHNKDGKPILDCHGNHLQYLDLSRSFIECAHNNLLANDLFLSYRNFLKEYLDEWTRQDLYNGEQTPIYPQAYLNHEEISNMLDNIFIQKANIKDEYKEQLIKALQLFSKEYIKSYHNDFYPTDKQRILRQLNEQQLILKK